MNAENARLRTENALGIDILISGLLELCYGKIEEAASNKLFKCEIPLIPSTPNSTHISLRVMSILRNKDRYEVALLQEGVLLVSWNKLYNEFRV